MSLDRHLQRLWYGAFRPSLIPLLPLSWLFAGVVAFRRRMFRLGVLRSYRVDVPVIVIGNITVGGTGKTPFTIWLANRLAASGRKVGIVLRGYGGRATSWPRQATPESDWEEVGDEAVLLARRTNAIVVVGPDRVADARLATALGAQVILSDDGLQHYSWRRDLEIVVIDGERGLGNGRLLPAGPLREPSSRLATVDLHVITRRGEGTPRATKSSDVPTVMAVPKFGTAVNLASGEVRALATFADAPVHAIAAVGHPESFFEALRRIGLTVRGHAYADHASLAREHIDFGDAPVLMTEKDAVKCSAIADRRHWTVPLEIALNDEDENVVATLIERTLGSAPR